MQMNLDQWTRTKQKDRILAMLQAQAFVPSAALRLVAYQYNARIHELRREGHFIGKAKDERGRCGFTYVDTDNIWVLNP